MGSTCSRRTLSASMAASTTAPDTDSESGTKPKPQQLRGCVQHGPFRSRQSTPRSVQTRPATTDPQRSTRPHEKEKTHPPPPPPPSTPPLQNKKKKACEKLRLLLLLLLCANRAKNDSSQRISFDADSSTRRCAVQFLYKALARTPGKAHQTTKRSTKIAQITI